MSLIDWFIDNPDLDPTDATILGALKRYGQFQTMGRIGEAILPDQDRDLRRESSRLDIAMKKRALGMNDSETYDESRNEDLPLYALTARHALQKIPEAGFLEGPKLRPFYKIARSTDVLGPSSVARRIVRAIS